jgi:hypothetical protein
MPADAITLFQRVPRKAAFAAIEREGYRLWKHGYAVTIHYEHGDIALEADCVCAAEHGGLDHVRVRVVKMSGARWTVMTPPRPALTSAVLLERGYLLAGNFETFQQWVNYARSWIGRTDAVLFDQKGRQCRIGGDLMRANADGAFPVDYYFPPGVLERPPLSRKEWAERAQGIR